MNLNFLNGLKKDWVHNISSKPKNKKPASLETGFVKKQNLIDYASNGSIDT